MTLKKMREIAAENGYTAEYIFNQGLNCLLSANESLKADRANPLKYQIDRITHDMHDIHIAENILREWYGIKFVAIDAEGGTDGTGKIHIYHGIDEVAKALDREAIEDNNFGTREKRFKYDWIEFLQLAERYTGEYRKAFDNPDYNHYSTTYEKVYGGAEE